MLRASSESVEVVLDVPRFLRSAHVLLEPGHARSMQMHVGDIGLLYNRFVILFISRKEMLGEMVHRFSNKIFELLWASFRLPKGLS